MKPTKAKYSYDEKISKEQLIGLFVMAKENGKTSDDVKSIAQSLGYESRKDILQKDIELIELQLKFNLITE